MHASVRILLSNFRVPNRILLDLERKSSPKVPKRIRLDEAIQVTGDYDPDTEIVMVGAYPPGKTGPGPINDEEIQLMVLLVTFKDTEEDAREALQPAEESHPPGTVNQFFCQPTSLEDQYCNQEAANPSGHRYCTDNAYIKNDADVVSVLEPAFTSLPSRQTFSLWYSMAPVSRRKLPDMALSMQSDHYFALYSVWKDDKDDKKCQDFVRNVMKYVEGHEEGAYLGDSDFQIRRTRFWAPEQGKKLRELRKKWDPKGRICGYLDVNDESGVEGLMNEFEAMDLSKL